MSSDIVEIKFHDLSVVMAVVISTAIIGIIYLIHRYCRRRNVARRRDVAQILQPIYVVTPPPQPAIELEFLLRHIVARQEELALAWQPHPPLEHRHQRNRVADAMIDNRVDDVAATKADAAVDNIADSIVADEEDDGASASFEVIVADVSTQTSYLDKPRRKTFF